MKVNTSILDILISNIPLYPPLCPGGDVTISEMYPDLTEEELDYVMSKYQGEMERMKHDANENKN